MQLALFLRNTLNPPGADQREWLCHLNFELQRVVTDIRELPGLSRSPLPSPFPDLQRAASGGPVIIVNASQYSCDALIVFLDPRSPTDTNANADNAFAFVFVCEWSWSPTSLILGWYGQYPWVWKSIPAFRPVPVTTSIDPSRVRYGYER